MNESEINKALDTIAKGYNCPVCDAPWRESVSEVEGESEPEGGLWMDHRQDCKLLAEAEERLLEERDVEWGAKL